MAVIFAGIFVGEFNNNKDVKEEATKGTATRREEKNSRKKSRMGEQRVKKRKRRKT